MLISSTRGQRLVKQALASRLTNVIGTQELDGHLHQHLTEFAWRQALEPGAAVELDQLGDQERKRNFDFRAELALNHLLGVVRPGVVESKPTSHLGDRVAERPVWFFPSEHEGVSQAGSANALR